MIANAINIFIFNPISYPQMELSDCDSGLDFNISL